MSRALARLLRPGGRIAFLTIHPTPGLTPTQRRRALRDGPWAVASSHTPRQLLARAGLVEVDVVDQTAQFRETALAWIEQRDRHRDALIELYGDADFDSRQQERRMQQQAINEGLLQRSLAVGRAYQRNPALDDTDSVSQH